MQLARYAAPATVPIQSKIVGAYARYKVLHSTSPVIWYFVQE